MTANRVFNFSPGPACLPLPVLKRVQQELLALPGAGASVLEVSHRGPAFTEILDRTKSDFRELIAIPDDYEILFLQGGSRLQFSMVPMNLLRGQSGAAEYVLTGSWSKKALVEAKREGEVRVVWDGGETNYDRLPPEEALTFSADAAYAYITSNETIQGVQFPGDIDTGGPPLVCDASSDFLCRPIDVARYGLIYACAQKNAGPAGVTIVIVSKDLLDRSGDGLPGYLNYREHARENSLYNTPPTFGIYVVGLIAQWLRDEIGGLAAMHRQNHQKAKLLYDVIDESGGFYRPHAQPAARSLMNVTFRLPDESLEKRFVAEAAAQDLCELKGHRSVGGIRASIYNAMPPEGVQRLAEFMRSFCETQR